MLTQCATELARGMALTIRSCERLPTDVFSRQPRLEIPDLRTQVRPREYGIGAIRRRLLQRERNRKTLLVTTGLEGAEQRRMSLRIGVWRHTTPYLSAYRPPGCPSLLGEVDEHARKMRVAATVEILDRPEMRADEEGLHHHLVPGIFAKAFDRIGIAMSDGLEHGLHA